MIEMKTSVAIIGAGPSGLLLSQLLSNAGIGSVIVERSSKAHVLGRIRAGVMEWGTVEILKDAGVSERCLAEGLPHDGFDLFFNGERHRVDVAHYTGKQVMVYGQTEVTKDLIEKREAQGQKIFWSTPDAQLHDVDGQNPKVTFTDGNGETVTLSAEFIAGCDGFRGISRQAIPQQKLQEFERIYPFGWLGVLVDKPPLHHELIYANHEEGFALASMRSQTRSRYYVQCESGDVVENWTVEQFWNALATRLGPEWGPKVETGDPLEMSIAPLRSYVAEPMQYGRLFLAGDSAHIVPPTGAKGLNLALADVRRLARAIEMSKLHGSDNDLDNYGAEALDRVWKVERFSWYLSTMMHQFPEHSAFEKRMQEAEFKYVKSSEAATRSIAENYVGLPF